MTKPVRIFLITIGVLSIISGIYLIVDGSDMMEIIFAFFAGVSLIVGVVFFDKDYEKKSNL